MYRQPYNKLIKAHINDNKAPLRVTGSFPAPFICRSVNTALFSLESKQGEFKMEIVNLRQQQGRNNIKGLPFAQQSINKVFPTRFEGYHLRSHRNDRREDHRVVLNMTRIRRGQTKDVGHRHIGLFEYPGDSDEIDGREAQEKIEIKHARQSVEEEGWKDVESVDDERHVQGFPLSVSVRGVRHGRGTRARKPVIFCL